MKISIAIPFYNNSRFMEKTLEYIITDDRISEIIITDDKSDDDNLNKLIEIIEGIPKIKLIKNHKNIGVFPNKIKALSLCSNEWGILLDSDNTLGKDYIDILFSNLPWDDKIIYAPEWAKTFPGNPSHMLDYKWLSNKTIDKVKTRDLRSNAKFKCFVNTGNYFLNVKKFITTMNSSDLKFNDSMSCIDVFYANHIWLMNGNKIKVIKGMQYLHRLHGQSTYTVKSKSKQKYWENQFFNKIQSS